MELIIFSFFNITQTLVVAILPFITNNCIDFLLPDIVTATCVHKKVSMIAMNSANLKYSENM